MRFGLALMLSSSMHADIIPYPEIDEEQKKLAEDLIFNRHPNALAELIAYFEGAKEVTTSGLAKRIEVDPSWKHPNARYFRIVNRLKEGIENDVVQAIADRLKDGKSTKDGGQLVLKASSKEAVHELR